MNKFLRVSLFAMSTYFMSSLFTSPKVILANSALAPSPYSMYLTIDDGPSRNTPHIIQFLKSHNIPAIFYFRGDSIAKYKVNAVQAINEGFLIGNHSYSHPYFSKISLEECYEQILTTEKLIDECYQLAGKKRPRKVIRFPFGDRGAGPEINKPITEEQKIKFYAIQAFIKECGFEKITFEGVHDESIDSLWSFDTQDYKKDFIKDKAAFLVNLKINFEQLNQAKSVLLMHDFNFNFHLFIIAMDFFIEKKVAFYLPCYFD